MDPKQVDKLPAVTSELENCNERAPNSAADFNSFEVPNNSELLQLSHENEANPQRENMQMHHLAQVVPLNEEELPGQPVVESVVVQPIDSRPNNDPNPQPLNQQPPAENNLSVAPILGQPASIAPISSVNNLE